MRRIVFSLVVGIGILYWCLWVAAAFWVFYPTALGAELGTFAPLSDEEYADLRRSAIDFARTVEHKGIVLRAGSERTRAFEFSCKGVPLLLVDNGPLLFVDVMAEADRRAPDLLKFRETMYSRLTPSGRPGGPPGPPAEPVGLEAFVLKHRDGIDVSQQCR